MGAGLALAAWVTERAGIKLPPVLLIPVGLGAALLFLGGMALAFRDRRAGSGPSQSAQSPKVLSINQSGGITADTVEINKPAVEPRAKLEWVERNKQGVDGKYVSEAVIEVEPPGITVGKLEVQAHAPSVSGVTLISAGAGVSQLGPSGTRDGWAFTSLQNAYGRILLRVTTDEPEADIRLDGSHIAGATSLPPGLPPSPGPSFVIGGPGAKVGRASIKDSYSNSPGGFGGIYGDDIEGAEMEGNIHDPEGEAEDSP